MRRTWMLDTNFVSYESAHVCIDFERLRMFYNITIKENQTLETADEDMHALDPIEAEEDDIFFAQELRKTLTII